MSALIFDLDGTLVDSVYEHVATWHIAFVKHGVTVPAFEYHKRIGMTGAALVKAIDEAFSLGLDDQTRKRIETMEADEYHKRLDAVMAVPNIAELWSALGQRKIPWAIATSAGKDDAHMLLEKIACPADVVLVTKTEGGDSKPAPDTFAKAAQKLGVDLDDAMIVGDSVWDMLASRRSGALGIGVLTGGYSREELATSGAFRVYADVVEMSRRFTELGL